MGSFLWTLVNSFSPVYRRHMRHIRTYTRLEPAAAATETHRQLDRYLRYCCAYSPYWRRRWPREAEDFSFDDADRVLQLLPPLTKEDIRQHIDELRIDPAARKPSDGWPPIRKPSSIQSGGSTGVPTRVYADADYRERSRATRDFLYRHCGLRPGDPVYFIWGSPNELSDMKASFRKRVSSHLRGLRPVPAFGLTPERIVALRDRMRAEPSVRSAIMFVSAAETIVRYAAAHGLKFPRLDRVFTGGGLLHPPLRALLREHLADEVFDTYAGRDIGMIAHETPAHAGLSLTEWDTRVEVLDAEGRRVPPGGLGVVHVTQMTNYACALIRMSTGDTARWQPEPVGELPVPRLTELSGRTAEHLTAPSGAIIDPSAVIHVVGVVIGPKWLRKFQLAQRRPDAFELRVECWQTAPSAEELESLGLRVARELSALTGDTLQVTVALTDRIPPLASGKHQYCVCETGAPIHPHETPPC